VKYLNPLNDPYIEYLKVMISARIEHARESDRGASAIEWAIITGMLALIAIAIYAIIKTTIIGAANKIKTGP
jgi:Flp pilus assembly pilin Flp